MAAKSSTSQPKATWQDVEANDHIVRALCFKFFGPDFEDAAQEVRLHAWRKLPQFRGDAKFSTWFYRLVFNQCLVIARMAVAKKRPQYSSLEALAQDSHFDVVSAEPSPLRIAEAREIVAILEEARPKHLRRMRFKSEGNSYQDYADVRGIHLGTAKSDIHRARKLLKKSAVAAGVTK